MGGFAACLAEVVGGAAEGNPEVDGVGALEVGQGEGGDAVASVGGAEECEEGLVLADGQGLAVAEGEALGGEVEAENGDLTEERCTHGIADSLGLWSCGSDALVAAGVDAVERDGIVDAQIRLQIGVRLGGGGGGQKDRCGDAAGIGTVIVGDGSADVRVGGGLQPALRRPDRRCYGNGWRPGLLRG